MLYLRLTQGELEFIDQGIDEYLSSVEESINEDVHFSCKLVINAESRCFEVDIIVDTYDCAALFTVVNICPVDFDEFLDSYNAANNRKNE